MPTTTIYQFRLEAHMDVQCLYKSDQNIKMYPFRFRVHAHAIGNIVFIFRKEMFTEFVNQSNVSYYKNKFFEIYKFTYFDTLYP